MNNHVLCEGNVATPWTRSDSRAQPTKQRGSEGRSTKPLWNSFKQDHSKFKLTPKELALKKQRLTSKHMESCRNTYARRMAELRASSPLRKSAEVYDVGHRRPVGTPDVSRRPHKTKKFTPKLSSRACYALQSPPASLTAASGDCSTVRDNHVSRMVSLPPRHRMGDADDPPAIDNAAVRFRCDEQRSCRCSCAYGVPRGTKMCPTRWEDRLKSGTAHQCGDNEALSRRQLERLIKEEEGCGCEQFGHVVQGSVECRGRAAVAHRSPFCSRGNSTTRHALSDNSSMDQYCSDCDSPTDDVYDSDSSDSQQEEDFETLLTDLRRMLPPGLPTQSGENIQSGDCPCVGCTAVDRLYSDNCKHRKCRCSCKNEANRSPQQRVIGTPTNTSDSDCVSEYDSCEATSAATEAANSSRFGCALHKATRCGYSDDCSCRMGRCNEHNDYKRPCGKDLHRAKVRSEHRVVGRRRENDTTDNARSCGCGKRARSIERPCDLSGNRPESKSSFYSCINDPGLLRLLNFSRLADKQTRELFSDCSCSI